MGAKVKGQHLRLVFVTGAGQSPSTTFVTMAKTLNFHLAKQLENATTKDTTDTYGNWAEFDPVENSGDIQFGGLVAVPVSGTDTTQLRFSSFIDGVTGVAINWKISMVSGANNRVVGKTVCSGQGMLTNIKADGQLKQDATYSGTLTIVGPITVGTD